MNLSTKRINYNVPRRLVNQIRIKAAQQGMEPYYWIHKALEEALRKAQERDPC